MNPRPYQTRAISETWDWIRKNSGNICIVAPTGSGKSVIISQLCKEAIQNWPGTRILSLCAQKELIEQNLSKIKTMWPNAPVGVYSASVGKKEIDAITLAGIQSIFRKPELLGHIDIIIVDECDLISHKDEGMYRTLINDLKSINENIRVIGLTASPYRLGHGMITDKPAIFDDLIEPVTIQQLQSQGFLSNLKSKHTETVLSVEGVHKRGGEYIESELQDAMDTAKNNVGVVEETILKAGDRRAWLFFCSGVQHAFHIRDILKEKGIEAECVTGETSKSERERILDDFKSGKIRALTNANVLSRGFDYPGIDLIAFLRPTMSKGLYIQMAGRGLRVKEHTDHCLILDFAGLVAQHGPITSLEVESVEDKGEKEPGAPPCKNCPDCGEIVFISTMVCPQCGYVFPKEEKKLALHNDDIMGNDPTELKVTSWAWAKKVSKNSGKEMLVVTYYGLAGDRSISEYLCVFHGGFVGSKAIEQFKFFAKMAMVDDVMSLELSDALYRMERGRHPDVVRYVMDGKFPRVQDREYVEEEAPF